MNSEFDFESVVWDLGSEIDFINFVFFFLFGR